jgi:cyclomaltodextrinase
VADLVAEVMLHWLRRGIAGWRLDVAYEVPPEFWREVTGRVRREFPGVLFLGEMIHGDYSGFVEASGLDTVTQYELWKGTWSSIKDRNFWELAWALDRHAGMCRGFVPQTFIGNHDVTRIASEVGDDGAVLAATALFTLPGMPSVYYGDEQAFQGRKLEGLHADDELRPPLPASPAELSPAGEWMYRIYQRLIGLRRRNPWLSRGRLKVIAKENAWIEYRMSGDAPDQDLRVRLALEPQCSATVMCGGETAFHWER